jgi:hypothetical protein
MEGDVGLELAGYPVLTVFKEVAADEISEVAIYAVAYLSRELSKRKIPTNSCLAGWLWDEVMVSESVSTMVCCCMEWTTVLLDKMERSRQ